MNLNYFNFIATLFNFLIPTIKINFLAKIFSRKVNLKKDIADSYLNFLRIIVNIISSKFCQINLNSS